MRPAQQKNRMRGRGRKGPNPLSRSYESNGPDVKIRGNAQHIAEKYSTLARDAAASGDRVIAENYLQHAEHYYRIVAAAQPQQQMRDSYDENQDDDDDDQDSGNSYQDVRNDNSDRQPQARNDRNDRSDRNDRGNRDGNRDRDSTRDRDTNRDRDGSRSNNGNNGNRTDRDRNDRSDRDRNDRDRNDRDRDRDGRREPFAADGTGPQPAIENGFVGAAREGDRQRSDEVKGNGNGNRVVPGGDDALVAGRNEEDGDRPRRRGRTRRKRPDDGFGSAGAPDERSTSGEAVATSDHVDSHQKIETPAHASASEEAPVKRKPGRPRKKKDDSAEKDGGGENDLPDFLMASNG